MVAEEVEDMEAGKGAVAKAEAMGGKVAELVEMVEVREGG